MPTRAQVAAPGYAETNFATGFINSGGIGPLGLAIDSSGNLYVADLSNGNIYKFGPAGGVASAATQLASLGAQGPTGMAFGKDGNLYVTLQNVGQIVQLDPSTGTIIRTVTSAVPGACGLATDPYSGDLFASTACKGGSTIFRISNFASGTGTVTTYATIPNADGLAFGPDGTLYAAEHTIGVAQISGTSSPQPATSAFIASIPAADGMAISLNITAPFLYSNNNDGTITKIYLSTNPPTLTNIVTGGSRGDFATVGIDGCLYASQTDRVIKVTNADGTCPPAPLGPLFQANPSVTEAVFTSTGASIPTGGSVPTATSVFDTAKVTGVGTIVPTGSVTYTFFPNNACSGSGTSQTVTLSSGLVPNSATQPSLANGDYSFQAKYSGDSNYLPSTSACDWFTVGSDFSLTNSGPISVAAGGFASTTIVATLTSGSSFTVSLSCSGAPSGASCSLNPTSGPLGFTSTVTISTLSSTPTGSFPITVIGSGGGLARTTKFTLTVNPPPPPPPPTVGGVIVPISKLALLAPFLGLASLIFVLTTVTVVYARRVKHVKEEK